YLPKYVWPFNKVDDALGVVYTHGFAGLFGGILVGCLADPKMIVYLGLGKNPSVTTSGLFYGHPRQVLIQLGAAATVIVWDAIVTYVILRVIKFFTPLRYSDAELEAGDIMVHGEVAYPMEEPDVASPAMIGDGTPDGSLPHNAALAESSPEVISD
ncbi:MAG: hypothetical protein WAL16_08830, partial [Streptosporangiaceae bacterium]